MRIRTIRPQFFMNDELALCGPLVRLAFIGLWCAADAQGRMEDRPIRLKAEILPHDEIDFEEVLAVLAEHDFIRRYEAGGKKLIQVTTFLVHQRISVKEAAQGSQYPPPPEGWQPPEKKPRGKAPRTRGQLEYERDADTHGREHADINAGGDKGTTPAAQARARQQQLQEEAAAVYDAYPRKVGRPVALRAIVKALQNGGQASEPDWLLARTALFARTVAGQDPQFIPHPSTWFNQARYNDDPSTWTRREAGVQNSREHNPNLHMAGADEDGYAALGRSIVIGQSGPPAQPEPPADAAPEL